MADKPPKADPEGETPLVHEVAHLIGMCRDWAYSPMLEDQPGAQDFILACGDAMKRQRDLIEAMITEVSRWSIPASEELERIYRGE